MNYLNLIWEIPLFLFGIYCAISPFLIVGSMIRDAWYEGGKKEAFKTGMVAVLCVFGLAPIVAGIWYGLGLVPSHYLP